MAAQAVRLGNHEFGVFENSNYKDSVLDQVIRYAKTSSGTYRLLQLTEKVSKATSMILEWFGNQFSSFFAETASKFSAGLALFTLTRIPESLKKAWQAIHPWGQFEGPCGNAMRGHLESVSKVTDFTSTVGYSASLLFNNTPIKNAADVSTLVGDVTNLTMAAQDMNLAGEHLKQIDGLQQPALKERFEETRQEAMFRVAKAVCSVVSGVAGLMVLAFGGPVLPAAALLSIGLCSTIMSVTASLYKEMAHYELVNFFEWRLADHIN